MNIYEKMSAITTELCVVAKNLMVGEGRGSYKATGEADVLAAVKPLEAKYRVYSYPASRHISDSGVLTTRKEYTDRNDNTTVTESKKLYMRIETVYRFVNLDDPQDDCTITTYGDGVDSNDKAPGKAMTYSDKYALLKAYKIITGDDPDQEKSPENEKTTKFRRANPVCEVCGAEVKPFRRNGTVLKSAQEMADGSIEKYGQVLCLNCMRKVDGNDGNIQGGQTGNGGGNMAEPEG